MRAFVDKGSNISSDIIWDVPQVQLHQIYGVSQDRQAEGLGIGGKETEEERKKEEEANTKNEDDLRKVKRNRALLRRPTDENNVPFMTHVVPAQIVKEFLFELDSRVAIFGTSEVGVAPLGALALKVPVVLFCNNSMHEKILEEALEKRIMQSCLAGDDFSPNVLVQPWKRLQSEEVDSDEESSSHSDGETSSGSSQEKRKKRTRGKKKEKDKVKTRK